MEEAEAEFQCTLKSGQRKRNPTIVLSDRKNLNAPSDPSRKVGGSDDRRNKRGG